MNLTLIIVFSFFLLVIALICFFDSETMHEIDKKIARKIRGEKDE